MTWGILISPGIQLLSYYWYREHPSGQPQLGDSGHILVGGNTYNSYLKLTPWNLLKMTKGFSALKLKTIQCKLCSCSTH